MQLTRAADYAVRVMIHLATIPVGERSLLPELARATGAPASFLSKVLQELCRAGLIASRRGQSGGFEALPTGRQASMRQVIEAIDGPIYLNLCLMSGASCRRKSSCPAHPAWVKAQEAMLAILDTTMIPDLAAQAAASAVPGAAAQPAPSRQKAASKAKPARRLLNGAKKLVPAT
jgi:Rrf2 family protein